MLWFSEARQICWLCDETRSVHQHHPQDAPPLSWAEVISKLVTDHSLGLRAAVEREIERFGLDREGEFDMEPLVPWLEVEALCNRGEDSS